MGQINELPITTAELAGVDNASAPNTVLVVEGSTVKQMDVNDFLSGNRPSYMKSPI